MLPVMRLTALAATVILAHSATAYGHIAMTRPAPRSDAQKAGPCGATGSTRSTNVTTYRPGETITVEWDETVDHPGHYRIAFDDNGNDSFRDPNLPNDNFPQTLVDQITDKVVGRYSQQVTLPNMSCTNCTLQLVQVMTTTVPYNSFYYQCADLVLSNGTDPGPGPDPDPGPSSTDGGCAAGGSGSLAAGLGLLGLALRRRRRQ